MIDLFYQGVDMSEKDSKVSDVQKTINVAAIFNLAMLPMVARLGGGPTSFIIALGGFALHEIGRSKKNSGWFPGLFPPYSNTKDNKNVAENICTGSSHSYFKC